MSTPLASPRSDGAPTPSGAQRDARWSNIADRASRYLSVGLLVVLIVLLVEVLFESWVQELLGNRTVGDHGQLVGYLPDWPKDLKNGLVLALAVMSAAKITVERRWREFRTRADIAIIVLALIFVVAGLLGTSGPVLIGQAVFVYLRGAVVFYAVRALNPSWAQAKRVLWVVGSVIGLNVAVALVQLIVGRPAYSGLGWVDLSSADVNRAQGLLDHPNHLGHVLGLVLIGLIAWATGLPRVTRLWWLAIGVTALGVAASQSRESMAGTVVAAAVIWFLRRAGGRTVLISSAVIVVLFTAVLVVRPGNLTEFIDRVRGVSDAVVTPSGDENCAGFATNRDCVEAGKVQEREIRMLFYQQGARLLIHQPVLGYGVGQFGGIVAEQHDPHWELNPRFPGGFNLYDFDGTTVDSFWLHLTIETGLLGLFAYLVWLWLLIVPLLGVTKRFVGRRVWGSRYPRGPTDERGHAAALWGVGVMLFSVVIGFFSPALEDALYPSLFFAVVGLGWVLNRDVRNSGQHPGEPSQTAQGLEGRTTGHPAQ
jgi:O-Antigen ligase